MNDYQIPEPKMGDKVFTKRGQWGRITAFGRLSCCLEYDRPSHGLDVDWADIRLILRGPMGQLGVPQQPPKGAQP